MSDEYILCLHWKNSTSILLLYGTLYYHILSPRKQKLCVLETRLGESVHDILPSEQVNVTAMGFAQL